MMVNYPSRQASSFTFLEEKPGGRDRSLRKQVRSHVTRLQHKKRRQDRENAFNDNSKRGPQISRRGSIPTAEARHEELLDSQEIEIIRPVSAQQNLNYAYLPPGSPVPYQGSDSPVASQLRYGKPYLDNTETSWPIAAWNDSKYISLPPIRSGFSPSRISTHVASQVRQDNNETGWPIVGQTFPNRAYLPPLGSGFSHQRSSNAEAPRVRHGEPPSESYHTIIFKESQKYPDHLSLQAGPHFPQRRSSTAAIARASHGSPRWEHFEPSSQTSTQDDTRHTLLQADADGLLEESDPEEQPLELTHVHPPRGMLQRSFSRGTVAFRISALADPDNIVGESLAGLGLNLPTILGFYDGLIARQSQDFEQQYAGEVTPGTALGEYNKRFRKDPAPLLAAILIIARAQIILRTGRPDPTLSPRERCHLIQLRGFLNRHVNNALDDPVRRISDPVMIAVSICATLEIRQANFHAYQVHMHGLRQMINLRGGFAGIGRSDPYLGRFLLWQDSNASSLANLPTFFDKENDDATIKAMLRPDPNIGLLNLNLPPICEDAG